MNGAAARAAKPIGSRPPRRAIVGSRVVTRAAVTPTPIDATSVEGKVASDRALLARRRKESRPDHEYLEAARPACEVSCRARRWVRRRVDRD